jgi:hypothetical protein
LIGHYLVFKDQKDQLFVGWEKHKYTIPRLPVNTKLLNFGMTDNLFCAVIDATDGIRERSTEGIR